MKVFEASVMLIGKELTYVGPITKKTTRFKVKEVKTAFELVSGRVYGDLILVSENGTYYSLLNDTILWK